MLTTRLSRDQWAERTNEKTVGEQRRPHVTRGTLKRERTSIYEKLPRPNHSSNSHTSLENWNMHELTRRPNDHFAHPLRLAVPFIAASPRND